MDAKTQALQMAQADALLGHSCGCVGPQSGQPLCPCKMRGVIVRDGRYIMPERDLGPALSAPREAGRGASRPFDLSFYGKYL